jgi:hypothetical protein
MSPNPIPDGNSVFRIFEQMFRLPVAAFVYTMEMFVRTMHGLQHMAENGSAGPSQAPPNFPLSPTPAAPLAPSASETVLPIDPPSRPAVDPATQPNLKERTHMPDTNLNDDMLKLVRYKILFVKREYETAFQEKEDLVSDNMSGSAFTAWKIAEFMQNIGEYDMPYKWKHRNYPSRDHIAEGKLTSLPEDDKKYLRVYYEVLERYPREKFKYEEQQIEILRDISNTLKNDGRGGTGSQTSSSAPASSK